MAQNACPYIASGLVFWLDGIIKSADNGEWTDLIGRKQFALINCTKTQNAVRFVNGSYGDYIGSVGTGLQNDTIEIVTDGTDNSECLLNPVYGYIGFIRGTGTNASIYMDGQWHNKMVVAPTDLVVSANSELYLHNGLLGSYASVDSWSNSSDFTRIGKRNIGSYQFAGDIHCIRIYSRHLSQEEMLQNQRIDNKRFNLGLDI